MKLKCTYCFIRMREFRNNATHNSFNTSLMEEKEKRSPLLRELLYIPNLQSPMKTGKRRPIRGCWSGRGEKGRFSVGGSHERRLAARRAVRGKYLLMKSFCSLARERKGQKNAREEEEEKEEQKVRSSYYFSSSSSRVSLFTSQPSLLPFLSIFR